MHAADCREVSTPAGSPPTISDDAHRCQDAVEMRERQEVEGTEEAGRDSAVTVSSNGNEETGIQDIVNDKHAIQDAMSGAQRSVEADKDGKTADAEQSGNRRKSLTKYPKEHTEHEDNEEFNRVRQNINADLGGTQDVGQDYGLRSVSVDKQGGERVEIDLEVDKEGKTGADERGMESEREKVGYIQQKHIQSSRRSLTENQGVDGVEKTSQGDSQPKPCPEFNKDTVEGRCGSKLPRILYAKEIEEEFRHSPSGIKISSETKYIKIEISQDGTKSLVEVSEEDVKRKPDPKMDAKVMLSSGFCNLNLNKSPSPEPQKHNLDLHKSSARRERDKRNLLFRQFIQKNAKKCLMYKLLAYGVQKKQKTREKKRKLLRYSARMKQHGKQ